MINGNGTSPVPYKVVEVNIHLCRVDGPPRPDWDCLDLVDFVILSEAKDLRARQKKHEWNGSSRVPYSESLSRGKSWRVRCSAFLPGRLNRFARNDDPHGNGTSRVPHHKPSINISRAVPTTTLLDFAFARNYLTLEEV